MYITIDENKFITTASWGGLIDDGIEVEDFEFIESINAYKYENNQIVLDESRLQTLQVEAAKHEEIQELQSFLNTSQAVVTQAFEEEILGIKSNDNKIVEVVKRRHRAKLRISELQEEIT